jgi:hypothetical protein
LEPRIGADWIEAGPADDRWVESLFIGFFQGCKRLIFIVET